MVDNMHIKKSVFVYDKNKNFVANHSSVTAASKVYFLNKTTIRNIANKNSLHSSGYYFRYERLEQEFYVNTTQETKLNNPTILTDNIDLKKSSFFPSFRTIYIEFVYFLDNTHFFFKAIPFLKMYLVSILECIINGFSVVLYIICLLSSGPDAFQAMLVNSDLYQFEYLEPNVSEIEYSDFFTL